MNTLTPSATPLGITKPKTAHSTTASAMTQAWACSVQRPAPAYTAFDIPTGAPPSPLFGAQPFTVQMLRFEEFGNQDMPDRECPDCLPFPQISGCGSMPNGDALDVRRHGSIDYCE